MNELKTNINGKFPFVLNDIRFFDDIYRSAINSLLEALAVKSGDVIVSGCRITTLGNTGTLSAGSIWLNGELLIVPEQTFSYIAGHNYFLKLKEYYLQEGRKTFGDNTTHETYLVRTAEVHDGGTQTNIADMIRIRTARLVGNAPGHIPRISTHPDFSDGLLPNAIVGTSSSGALVSCAVKSAHNKEFGISHGNVPPIGEHGLNYNQLPYGIVMYDVQDGGLNTIGLNSAFNKDFGTGHNEVARGDHNHNTIYEPIGNNPDGLITRVIEIGEWNMQSSNALVSLNGISFNKIISVSVLVTNDAQNFKAPIDYTGNAADSPPAGGYYLSSSNNSIIVTRRNGGYFDDTNFSSILINRGWLMLTLLP